MSTVAYWPITIEAHSGCVVGKQELMIDPVQEWQCENRASISPQLFLPGIIGRSMGSSSPADAGLDGWGAAATAASAALRALFLLLIAVVAALAYSIAGSGNHMLTSGLNDLVWAGFVLTSFPRAMLVMASAFGLWRARLNLERALRGRGRCRCARLADNYSYPSTMNSDAFLAMDLDSGKILWSR